MIILLIDSRKTLSSIEEQILVKKFAHYFIIEHHEKVLNRSSLELGYSFLSELCTNHRYTAAICDLSRCVENKTSKKDFEYLRDPMTYVFSVCSPKFKLYIIDSNNFISETVKNCHEYMKSLDIEVNAGIYSHIEDALAEIKSPAI